MAGNEPFFAADAASPGKADPEVFAPIGGVASAVKAEKVGWYREVLALEPGSKIFLPFARLLEEMGRITDAVQVLRDGLEKHPEFIEARLFLIDILHKSSQPELCGAEVARLAGLFREYPGFWDAWSAQEQEGVHKPDLSVSLGFLGAMFRDCDITFVDVLSAGLRALQTKDASAAQGMTQSSSLFHVQKAPAPTDAAMPAGAPVPAEANYPLPAPQPDSLSAPSSRAAAPSAPSSDAPSLSASLLLDVEPNLMGDMLEADGDEADLPPLASPPPFVFREYALLSDQESPKAEKCSLRTRSMAEVLAEQGDLRGAVDIYSELLHECLPEDQAALEARLTDLRARLGDLGGAPFAGRASASGTFASGASVSPSRRPSAQNPSTQPRNGVLDLLEKLAVRLETKARQ